MLDSIYRKFAAHNLEFGMRYRKDYHAGPEKDGHDSWNVEVKIQNLTDEKVLITTQHILIYGMFSSFTDDVSSSINGSQPVINPHESFTYNHRIYLRRVDCLVQFKYFVLIGTQSQNDVLIQPPAVEKNYYIDEIKTPIA